MSNDLEIKSYLFDCMDYGDYENFENILKTNDILTTSLFYDIIDNGDEKFMEIALKYNKNVKNIDILRYLFNTKHYTIIEQLYKLKIFNNFDELNSIGHVLLTNIIKTIPAKNFELVFNIKGIELNKNLHYGSTLLNLAVELDKIELVKILLKNGAKQNVMPNIEKLMTGLKLPIINSAINSNYEMFKLLVNNGADITNEFIAKELTEIVLKKENIKMLNYLIDNCKATSFQLTLFNHAIDLKNSNNIIPKLFNNGLTINDSAIIADYKDPQTVLTILIKKEKYKILYKLLSNNELTGYNKEYILHHVYNNISLVGKMLHLKADINYRGKMSPLMLAANDGDEKLIDYFINKKADVNISFGNITALSVAVEKNNLSLVKKLLENNAMVKGELPIFYAVKNNNIDLLNTLVERMDDLNLYKSIDIFEIFAELDNITMTKFLLNSGEKIFSNEHSPNHPLITCSKKGNIEMLKLFLDVNNYANIPVYSFNTNPLKMSKNAETFENSMSIIDPIDTGDTIVNPYPIKKAIDAAFENNKKMAFEILLDYYPEKNSLLIEHLYQFSKKLDMAEILIKKINDNPNHNGYINTNTLSHALLESVQKNYNTKFIKLLIDNNANIAYSKPINYDWHTDNITILHHAIDNLNMDVIELVTENTNFINLYVYHLDNVIRHLCNKHEKMTDFKLILSTILKPKNDKYYYLANLLKSFINKDKNFSIKTFTLIVEFFMENKKEMFLSDVLKTVLAIHDFEKYTILKDNGIKFVDTSSNNYNELYFLAIRSFPNDNVILEKFIDSLKDTQTDFFTRVSNEGLRPLTFAIYAGNFELVKLLVEKYRVNEDETLINYAIKLFFSFNVYSDRNIIEKIKECLIKNNLLKNI